MARKSQDRRRIEFRLDEISDRLSILETEVEQLKSERMDLINAARVLDKLSGATDSSPIDSDGNEDVDQTDFGGVQNATDVPRTIGDMAMNLLCDAGEVGLTSTEILEAIRGRWLPSLMRTSLSPPLSRLKEKGEIKLVEDKWIIDF